MGLKLRIILLSIIISVFLGMFSWQLYNDIVGTRVCAKNCPNVKYFRNFVIGAKYIGKKDGKILCDCSMPKFIEIKP